MRCIMLLCNKITIEVNDQEAQTLAFMQEQCP